LFLKIVKKTELRGSVENWAAKYNFGENDLQFGRGWLFETLASVCI
jgi:hypothetical protein